MATITQRITDVVTSTITATTSTSTARAPAQAGIFEGANPSVYNPSSPIILFIIQASIILIFCRLLHYPLSLLRQPRVIAEVIGGILLGPSVMGRIPGFTDTIFPSDSIPNLSLVANIGLVLFLFLVGLEVDLRYFVSNWKLAVSVGIAGMALPFGLGCAISYGLYKQFRDEPGVEQIEFGTYMLFIGIAMAITAFPVLCRILTELKLLSTPVGVIVLSAGVGNDVVGWVLLALCVALVNAGSGLTAVWVLLTCVGYALFLGFAVRPAFMWLLQRTRAIQDGPSQGVIGLTLLMALGSAFFTGVIGIHPVFGAFMAGLICPHEGGFAIKVTEKIEDLVGALFLPLYFTLSGLSTNLGLLDNGTTWAYVIGVITIAFCGKFLGCSFAARLNGLVWRESFTIGSLMSCKGLVELIVLNIGLQAKILSTRTFTIFVVMALVTTFATTPLTRLLYPPWYQRKLEAWKRGEIDWNTGEPIATGDHESEDEGAMKKRARNSRLQNLLVYLRMDSMPALLALVSLFGSRTSQTEVIQHPSNEDQKDQTTHTLTSTRPVEVHGVRLVELTERSSSVMKVSEVDEYSMFDPIINAFRVLGQLYNLAVSGEVVISPESSFSETLVTRSAEESSDLLILPWSETMSESLIISKSALREGSAHDTYSCFVTRTLATAECHVAIFVDKGFGGSLKQRPSTLSRHASVLSTRSTRENVAMPVSDRSHHIFCPYFGGADDRLAVSLVLQLADNPEITATIVHYQNFDTDLPAGSSTPWQHAGDGATQDTKDDAAFFSRIHNSMTESLRQRIAFETVASPRPLDSARERAQSEMGGSKRNGGNLLILGRGIDQVHARTSTSCLGFAAEAMLESGIHSSVLVLQSRAT